MNDDTTTSNTPSDQSSRHDIDVLLTAAAQRGTVTIPQGWGQGRATFGGVVAGVLVARVLGELNAEPTTLRSLTVNFVAPASAGAAEVRVEVLRQGKSATQVEARLMQPDDSGESIVRAVALLTFGAQRESKVALDPTLAAGERPAFETLEAIPYVEGVAPEFIARVDLRPASGAHPFSAASGGDLTGYMRFRELTADFGVAHLVTLIDGWPPAAGQMLHAPAPMSTMTWTLEFTAPVSSDPTTTWWYDVTTDAAHDGYAHSGARIYDPASGALVAISRQTVALFG